MIYAAILGYGTVGSGVAEVIHENREAITKRTGEEIKVKYILDLRDFPGDKFEDRLVHDVNVIMNDPEVKVVCETMGGVGAAYEFTKSALSAGKSVCTSNKELVALHGAELFELAKKNNCSYLYEASVGGGIPLIRPIVRSLTAEIIESIVGILNGTTNYILTKMDKEGADFEDVLKQAQDLGYAERNPEADIEGHDAARKISILSSLMTGKRVDSECVSCEGITAVTPVDFEYAKSLGCSIKLLGISERAGDKVKVLVAPHMVPFSNPLSCVNDVFNAVVVNGNMVGQTMFFGRGAGSLPTASAVASDLIEAACNIGKCLGGGWSGEPAQLLSIDDSSVRYFVRVRTDAVSDISRKIPGGAVIRVQGDEDDAGYLAPVMTEKEYKDAFSELGDKVLGTIRMYGRE